MHVLSSHHHYHHHLFGSRFHKWVRICDIWSSELGLSWTAWWSPVPSFSCKWHNFIFLYGWVIFSLYIHMYIIFSLSICLFCCWAPWLIPQFGYCEENCNKHGCTGILLHQNTLKNGMIGS
jgi:hypothetical protein